MNIGFLVKNFDSLQEGISGITLISAALSGNFVMYLGDEIPNKLIVVSEF